MRTLIISFLFIFLVLGPSSSLALPWDWDMSKQSSLKANEIARAPAEGSVPLGGQRMNLNAQEMEEQLTNPLEKNLNNAWRGRRVWNSNCLSCHGRDGSGDGPLGPQMSVPSLLDNFYSSRSDGKLFATIFHGGANMPRYGYKLSVDEIWSLIHYLRFLQGTPVEGMSQP